jgi:hypothetical protein
MRRLVGLYKDHPPLVAVTLMAAIGLHRLLYDTVSIFPDVAHSMASFDQAWSVYLGFAGIVAISAGFAGVIAIFALGSTSSSFSRMRYVGGDRLSANWISPVATSLACALGSALCAVITITGHGALAWWIFEFLFGLSAASAVRLIWLFKRLTRVVGEDDRKAHEATQRPSLAQLKRSDAG